MEDGEYDYTQGSLSSEVQALLDKINNEHTKKDHSHSPSGTADDRSSPMTVLQAGDTAEKESATSSLGEVPDCESKVGRRRYINISETLEENRKLKALVFSLKMDIYSLKKELPTLKNAEGVDFTTEFLTCKARLDDERNAKLKLESELRGFTQKLEDFKSIREKEQKKWWEEKKALTTQRDQLQNQIEELTKENEMGSRTLARLREDLREVQSASACDSDVSQGDSSVFSVLSERDQQLEELRSLMFRKTAEAETMRKNFNKQIDDLVVDLKKKDEDLKMLTESLEKEKAHHREVEAEYIRLQDLLEESEECKIRLSKELDDDRARFEIELCKRDKAINALMRRYETVTSLSIPEAPATASGVNPPMDPALTGILHQVQEIDEKNVKIREKVIELATGNGSFDDPTASSGVLSTDEEMSEMSMSRIIKRNEKIAKYLIAARSKQQDGLDPVVREEVERKMAAFDAIGTEEDAQKEISSYYQNISAPSDLLNTSRHITHEVKILKQKLATFRSVCLKLFEKLRGSAGTLQKILVELCGGDEGHSLLDEVEAMRIDLNQSVNAADSLFNNLEAVQKNILELTEVFEHSVRQQLYNSVVTLECSQYVGKEDANEEESLKEEFEAERRKVAEAETRVKELASKIELLEADKKNLLAGQQAVETRFAELNAKLDEANKETCEAMTCCEKLTSEITVLRSTNADKENSLKCLMEQLSAKEREFLQYKTYFEELTRVETESRKLVQSLKETISSIPQKVVDVISGRKVISNEDQALQIAETDRHVIALKDEFAQMRLAINESAANLAALKTKYSEAAEEALILKKQKDDIASKLAIFEEKVKHMLSTSIQTDLKGSDLAWKDAEYERCMMENSISKHNVDKLCAAVSQLQTERSDIIPQKPLATVTGQENTGFLFEKTATMTDLRCEDIGMMELNLSEYCAFVNELYRFFWRKNELPYNLNKQFLTPTELNHLKTGLIDFVSDQRQVLDVQRCSNKQLEKKPHSLEKTEEFSSSTSSRYLKPSNFDSPCGTESAGAIGSETSNALSICQLPSAETNFVSLFSSIFTSKYWQRIYDSSNEIVQLMKAQKSQNCTTDMVDKGLNKSRILRSKIFSVQEQVTRLEKLKENVNPTMMLSELREEVLSLQFALSNANILLKQADERLAKHPNTESIRSLILDEMVRIRNVLKATQHDVAQSQLPQVSSVLPQNKK